MAIKARMEIQGLLDHQDHKAHKVYQDLVELKGHKV